jgi:hypothetical protein
MNTELIDGGFPVTVVSDRSGHRRTSTTTDIYSARLRRRQPEAATYLAGLIDGPECGLGAAAPGGLDEFIHRSLLTV